MAHDTTTQRLLFPEIFAKPVVVQFDQRQGSSDGGAILLKAADRRLQLTQALAACMVDKRQPGKVEHEIEELLAQRIYGIACGYVDANDAARLAEDPVHKLLVGRDPVEGADLASQPTLSRFENAPHRKQLYRMGEALADRVIERHRRRLHGRARCITIDLDPTDDPTHGAQQLTFFNSHYDTWCYLPVVGFVSFNDEKEQYLLTAVLRPGNVPASAGAIGILRRLLVRVRRAFPMIVNPFFSPVIRIQVERSHHVITRGPYRCLRHLGYLAMLVAIPASAIAVGSWLALIPAAGFCAVIVRRARTEDEFLKRNLHGYIDYVQRVPHGPVAGRARSTVATR